MNSKNSLLIGRGIFTIILIVSLGLIVMNEKGGELFKNKISKKIDSYLETNYQKILLETNKEDLVYKNNEFKEKITSKENDNLYFYIKYKDKKITDTYQTDYEEGNSLLTHLNKTIEEEIKKQTNLVCKVNSVTTLNNYSEKVQEKILKEDDLIHLKYYYIQLELTIKDWNETSIANEITNHIKIFQEKEITPKYYEIIITNKDDITTSINISNLTEEFIELDNKEEIIKDILNNKNTEKVQENKITFRYEN